MGFKTIALFTLLSITAFLVFPFFALSQESGFDPGFLVSDERFGNVNAFSGPEGIQKILEIRGSVLANTNSEFLKQLREPADVALKIRLEDPNPNLGRLRTAAELIYDAAQLAKINPQVILVTLQKEQSLIDTVWSGQQLQRRLDRAMGFACPDGGVCGDLFLGFYFQLFGNVDHEDNRYLGAARSLAKSFYMESGGVIIGRGPLVDSQGRTFGDSPKIRVSRVGDTITVDNTQGPPYNAPPTQTFVLKNSATAALYRYTPHVYNGNYNFWRFFHQWFKYPNGSLIKLYGQETVYFIDNGSKRPVSGTVLTQRKLDVTRAFILTPAEFAEYPEAKPLPPAEGTVVAPSSGGIRYLVKNNKLLILSNFVAGLRKLDLSKTVYLPDFEVNSYEIGGPALPEEGVLIRSQLDPTVYLVQDQKLRPVSGFVFKQRGFSFTQVVVATDSEIKGYPKATTLPPLDGTMVKATTSPLVYYVALGQKFPIPGFVFALRAYKFSDVVTLGQDEIDNLTLAEHLAPQDGTLLKASNNPTVYLVEAVSLHYITGFLFQHRGYKFSKVQTVKPEELAVLNINTPLYLADGTLISVDGSPTVYLLEEGLKKPLTYAAFTGRNYRFSDVVQVPKVEADRYPDGQVLVQ